MTLDKPLGNIVQYGKDFNFMSFIHHISHPDTLEEKKDTISGPSTFNILSIKIKDGEFITSRKIFCYLLYKGSKY